MKFDVSLLLKLTLNVGLLFGVISIPIHFGGNSYIYTAIENWFLFEDVTPINYTIDVLLTETIEEEKYIISFRGRCDITISIDQPTDFMSLQANTEYITDLDHILMSEVNGSYDRLYIFNKTQEHYQISFNIKLIGIFLLRVYFTTRLSDAQVFQISHGNRLLWLATHLRLTSASALFPCLDHPELKTSFEIIIHLDAKYDVLSNMKEKTSKPQNVKNANKIFFRPTPRMPASDVAIIIFDRDLFDGHSLLYKPNVTNNHEFALSTALSVGKHLKDKWNCFEKLLDQQIVLIPGFPHIAITKPGLIIFREEAVLYNASTDPFATKIEVVQLIARAIAHERLDILADPFSWSDLWLHEGIGMLLGLNTANKFLPELRLFDLFVVQIQQESLRLDAEGLIGPIMPRVGNYKSINSVFSFSHYVKAPVILNMFRRIVSEKIFWDGVQKYLTNNTKPDFMNFCLAMLSTVNEGSVNTSSYVLDVTRFMYNWAKRTRYLAVTVTQYKNSMTMIKYRVNADNLNIKMPEHYIRYYIWMNIITESQLDFEVPVISFLLELQGMEHVISLPLNYTLNRKDDDWIIVNSKQIGYYRVNYDAENWRRIGKCLNSENYTKIHVLNRAQIIDDIFHILMIGQIDLFTFLNLANYLSRETDYIAWYPMLKNLEYMSACLPFAESTFIKENLEVTLTEIFHLKIVADENLDDENIGDCLKQEVAKWACIFGSSYCKDYAEKFLTSETRKTVSPWWKEWIYCKGLMRADYATWKNIFDIYLNESDNKMLRYLACAEDAHVIIKYIELIANNTDVQDSLRKKGILTAIEHFHYIVARHSRNTLVLEYILENLDRILPKQINKLVAITDIINHIYSADHILKIMDSFFLQDMFSLVTSKLKYRHDEIEKQRKHFLYLLPKTEDDE